MAESAAAPAFENASKDYNIWSVIIASAVGTMIEWYDFYIFGSLAAIISPLFYPPGNDTLAMVAYLMTFAVGFVVRPDSNIKTGRDLIGLLGADAGSVSTAIAGSIGNHNYVALGAVTRAAKVEAGADVLVIGCGGVGLNVIQGARLAGARTIIACDLLDSKLG
ncbi:MAG: hypothetical protein AAB401_22020, partial [Acidobacteriota bacterium]